MQINKDAFMKSLAGSIICPSDMKIEVNKKDKICGYSVDCQRCWDEALGNVDSIELIGGIEECQK